MTATWSPPLDEFTTAVLALLNANPETTKVWPGAYGGSPTRPTFPHAILYRIPGGSADPLPDLDGPGREVTVCWQVTSVSNAFNECEHTGAVLRDQLLARDNTGGFLHQLQLPDGWQDIDRRQVGELPGIDRVGQHPTAVFNEPARYLLTFAPA